MNNGRFNFFVPVEFQKAEKAEKGSDEWYKNMYIWGVASTQHEDTDGEELDPNGFIIDRFLKQGLLNYEHQGKLSPKYHIGEPVEARVKNNEFFIKGKLWSESEIARDLWDTLNIMKSSGSKRNIGWSIEGKTLQKDPFNAKKITKALITHCALTFSPKNANTWADIVKGEQVEDYVEYELEENHNGGKVYLLDVMRPDGYRVTVDTDFKIKVEKSMNTQSGAPLMPESLNRDVKILQPSIVKAIKYGVNNFSTPNKQLLLSKIKKIIEV